MIANRIICSTLRPRSPWSRCLSASSVSKMPIKVGDALPSVEVYQNANKKVNVKNLFAGKKGILFALPGAFTPTCSQTHFPGYVKEHDKLKSEGVDVIACLSVNDPFVMEEWCNQQDGKGKVVMLSDVKAEFTKAVDLSVDAEVLGGVRSKRYSMVIEDGIVKELNLEPDGLGASCSLAQNLKFKF